MNNLVKTWLEAGKSQGMTTNTQILRKLNKDLGRRVMDNRLYEWRSGAQAIPLDVVGYMISESMGYAIGIVVPGCKVTKLTQRKLIKALSLPKRN